MGSTRVQDYHRIEFVASWNAKGRLATRIRHRQSRRPIPAGTIPTFSVTTASLVGIRGQKGLQMCAAGLRCDRTRV